jgi:hypothetical protein
MRPINKTNAKIKEKLKILGKKYSEVIVKKWLPIK